MKIIPPRPLSIGFALTRLPIPTTYDNSIKHIFIASMGTTRQRQQNRAPREGGHNIALSKQLSWLLRHGLDKSGLDVRTDGYVGLDDLVAPLPSQKHQQNS
jgi:RNA:NAD 2'-phosphotransferase (TPT1/KptA family)